MRAIFKFTLKRSVLGVWLPLSPLPWSSESLLLPVKSYVQQLPNELPIRLVTFMSEADMDSVQMCKFNEFVG